MGGDRPQDVRQRSSATTGGLPRVGGDRPAVLIVVRRTDMAAPWLPRVGGDRPDPATRYLVPVVAPPRGRG